MIMHAAPNHLARALLVLIVLAPLSAVADPKEEAQGHIAKAMEAHGKNDFATALVELQAAYALDPIPDLLYAIGQVHVKLDRCPEAVAYYEQYLATKPAAQATADTKQAIETCNVTTAPPPPPPEPPPPPPAVTTTEPAAWYKDKLGGALVLTGVVASAVGIVMYTGARSDLDDAESAMSLDSYNDLVDSAKSKRLSSVVLVGGGVALIGAGVIRYYLLRGSSNQEARGVGVVPAQGGGLVTWTGQF